MKVEQNSCGIQSNFFFKAESARLLRETDIVLPRHEKILTLGTVCYSLKKCKLNSSRLKIFPINLECVSVGESPNTLPSLIKLHC